MADTPSMIVSITQTTQADKSKFELFGNIDDVIGVIANYAQALTFIGIVPAGATLLSMIADAFFPGGPSDRQVLDEINQKLDNLIRFEHGFQQHLDMLDIDQIVTKAEDRLETLLREGPDSPDVNRSETIQDTLDAANFLGNRDFWERPFFQGEVFPHQLNQQNSVHVFWFGHTRQSLTPPADAGSGFVFDPTLALAAYMKAIQTRGCVLPIFHPADFHRVFEAEFSGRADVLTDRYNEMVSGLIAARAPIADEILHVDDLFQRVDVISEWRGTFGVVDIFTGEGIVDLYPLDTLFPPVNDSGFQMPWDEFLSLVLKKPQVSADEKKILFDRVQAIQDAFPVLAARLALGSAARLKAVYIARGLHDAWNVIQKLKQLAGRTDIEQIDRQAVWSLREINAMLPPLSFDPGELVDPTQRVRLTIGQLAIKLANLPTTEGLSLRSALDKATP